MHMPSDERNLLIKAHQGHEASARRLWDLLDVRIFGERIDDHGVDAGGLVPIVVATCPAHGTTWIFATATALSLILARGDEAGARVGPLNRPAQTVSSPLGALRGAMTVVV